MLIYGGNQEYLRGLIKRIETNLRIAIKSYLIGYKVII